MLNVFLDMNVKATNVCQYLFLSSNIESNINLLDFCSAGLVVCLQFLNRYEIVLHDIWVDIWGQSKNYSPPRQLNSEFLL